MTFEEFNEFQAELLAKVVKMNSTKGKEYANSESRFANFDRLAAELGIPNFQVGWVYAAKHKDSIASYCRNSKTYSTEPIRGRIVDLITYLTLIAGMIEESLGIMSTEIDKGYYNTIQGRVFVSSDVCQNCGRPYKDHSWWSTGKWANENEWLSCEITQETPPRKHQPFEFDNIARNCSNCQREFIPLKDWKHPMVLCPDCTAKILHDLLNKS